VQLDPHDVDTMLLLGQLVQGLQHCNNGTAAAAAVKKMKKGVRWVINGLLKQLRCD
jgi:hypothetical protein